MLFRLIGTHFQYNSKSHCYYSAWDWKDFFVGNIFNFGTLFYWTVLQGGKYPQSDKVSNILLKYQIKKKMLYFVEFEI